MEMFEEELEREGKEEKKGGGRFRVPKPPFPFKYALLGLGGLVVVVSFFALGGRKSVIMQQGDVEIINRAIEEQLKTQREMNKELLEEIKKLREEVKGGEKKEEKKEEKAPSDLLEVIRAKKEKKEEEEAREEKIKELEKKLKELEEVRKKEKEVVPREFKMEYKEREVKVEEKKLVAKGEEKKRTVFVPAGTVIKGRIVSGFFAPVGTDVRFPSVLIELQGSASTPNNFRIPFDKCRVVAKAEGDWVLERAKLQTYKLSCVLPNGKAVEVKFNASVSSGVDGMDGVKGRFVNASAKQLQTFFGTTFLGTLFDALAKGQVATELAVQGGVVLKNEVIKNEGEYAFYRALADTWKQFSQFYLEQAKNVLPVVLVEGNVPVYLEVVDGFSLEVSPEEMVARR